MSLGVVDCASLKAEKSIKRHLLTGEFVGVRQKDPSQNLVNTGQILLFDRGFWLFGWTHMIILP